LTPGTSELRFPSSTGGARGSLSPSFWRDRPVFVTGATGLVGGWLVKHLLAVGADVVCLVRDWVPRSGLVAAGLTGRVKLVRGDVRENKIVERALADHGIVTVLHLAAQAVVGVANRNPVPTLDTNIRGTWTLLEACRRSRTVQQIITASSDKAYGDQEVLPLTEAAPVSGRHPYDCSKSCADLLAQMYAKSYHLPVCITRCGNFYGGGDLNWSRIVPGTIRSVLRGDRPVIRSDGQLIRDYLYVEDGARAYLLLAEQLAARPALGGEVFNFSYERRMTVLQLVARVLEALGSNLEPDVRNEVSNEIKDQYLDAAKARTMLGWTPAFTFESGLRITVDWYKEHCGDRRINYRRHSA
jgi:CDP-glucose 4,6-dehydratase